MSHDSSPRIRKWSAEFADRALEAEYRRAGLPFEVRWAGYAAWISAAIILAFIPVDFLNLGNTPQFYAAMALRLAMGAGLLFARHWLLRRATPEILDRAIFVTEAVLIGGFFIILPVRAENFSLAALTALSVLLTILLLVPGRFRYTAVLSVIASVAFLFEDYWLQSPPFHEMIHVVVLFTVLQAYGIYTLYNLSLNRRREFLNTRELHEANWRLTEEAQRRQEMHRLLEESEANFRALFEGAPVPLILSSLGDYKVLEVNQTFLDLTGEQRGAVLENSMLWSFPDPSERISLVQALEESVGQVRGFELQLRTANGRILTVLASTFRTSYLGIPALLTSLTDISERKLAEEDLLQQADLDPLTGLVNRRGFLPHVGRETARWRRHGYPLSLILLDLDRFKEANDLYGSEAGDRILQAVARICRSTLRLQDLCGRLEGDEFVLLLPDTDRASAGLLAERLRRQIEMMAVDGAGQRHSISLGVAEFEAGDDFEAVLARADAALYRAKEGGRNRIEVAAAGAEESV